MSSQAQGHSGHLDDHELVVHLPAFAEDVLHNERQPVQRLQAALVGFGVLDLLQVVGRRAQLQEVGEASQGVAVPLQQRRALRCVELGLHA